MSFNKVILQGNLTRAPELKYTSGKGTPVAKAGIAINRITNVNGERREEVCFVDLTFWGRTAEIANQYLQKGSKVLIEGHLVLEQWQDANGQNRSKHSVTVETMQMLDTKKDQNVSFGNNEYDNYGDGGNYGTNQNYASAQRNYNQGGYQNNYNQGNYGGFQNGQAGNNFGGQNSYQGNSYQGNNYQGNNYGSNNFANAQNSAQNSAPRPAPKEAPAQEKLPEYDVDKDEIPF